MLIALLALAPACFSPEVDLDLQSGSDTDGSTGTGSETSSPTDATTQGADTTVGGQESGDTGSGSADATDTEPGDTDAVGSPPEIVSFTVDGSSQVSLDRSGGVAIDLEVVDDGEITSVAFFVDGETVDELMGPGTSFASEAIFSGAVDNGGRQVTVVVEDDEGDQVEGGPLLVQVSVPNGGVDESWRVPGGFAYGVAVDPEGQTVVVTGIAQESIGAASAGAVRRLEGGAWASESIGQSVTIADIVAVEDEYWAVGAIPSGGGRDTHFLQFNADGALVEASLIDAAADQGAGSNGVDFARRIRRFEGGKFLVVGGYEPADGTPAVASYVARVTPTGDLAWLDLVTESGSFAAENLFVYDAVVTPEQDVILVGSALEDGATQLWWGRLDSAGDVVGEWTLDGEYFESIGYSASGAADGSFVLGGTRRTSDVAQWRRWLRKYAADGTEEWTREGPADTGFVQAITHDEDGNVVAASTEGCELNAAALSYWHCALRVRKYEASDGAETWSVAGESGAAVFNGPLLYAAGVKLDLELDRYGFAYVSALYRSESPDRGEWWAARLHP